MFSRNRFSGQHGAGVAPKGGTKAKVHPPKKRAPNPRVALVIRGKIHRLLQGSADHRAQGSHIYYAGIEEEEEEEGGETQEEEKERRGIYPKVSQRAEAYSPRMLNGKGHGVALGPPFVGEVELNREGCVRIPCTLQHKSCRSPANLRQTSPEGRIRTTPEQMQAALHYNSIRPDINGTKFAGAAGRDMGSTRISGKRPYSTGDCVDYNFNRALSDTLLEEDSEGFSVDKEGESSDIIEHILKELRGINKIQEEISDLRDYLTSVRGSVEEVSSCVDAVLSEIEGIRSSNKAGARVHAGTWSGVGCKDGPSTHRRPASAYGSLGSTVPKSESNIFTSVSKERHSIHGELLLPRAEESIISPITESIGHQELEEPDETSDHSSDIPIGAVAKKLNFGYIERQDGQDCPSTSSLSSGHSSKSESDLERPSSSHGRKQQRADDGEGHWGNTGPPHSAKRESVWHRESTYLSRGSLEEQAETHPCCEGVRNWDHYRGAVGYGTLGQSSTGSSQHFPVFSGKHYNSPARTYSSKEWQSWKQKPHTQPGIHISRDTYLDNPSGGYECAAGTSYSQRSGYHSADGHCGEVEDVGYRQPTDLRYSTDCQVDCYQGTYSAYEESAEATWTKASVADLNAQFIEEIDGNNQSSEDYHLRSDSADVKNVGFNVKRIGQAVVGFSTVLRGALRKFEATGAQDTGGETEFHISVPSDIPINELPTEPLCYGVQFQATEEMAEDVVVERRNVTGDLSQTNVLGKSSLCPVEPLLQEANYSLTLESANNGQLIPCSDTRPPRAEEPSLCPDSNFRGTALLPPPESLKEPPAEGPADGPADVTIKTRLTRSCIAESPSVSLLPDELADREEQSESEATLPQQPGTDFAAAQEGKAEDDAAECPPEISEMDQRKLKCLRSFQQILQEKKETRRNLTSVTMSTFSQDDFEQGTSCVFIFRTHHRHWVHWILCWNELLFPCVFGLWFFIALNEPLFSVFSVRWEKGTNTYGTFILCFFCVCGVIPSPVSCSNQLFGQKNSVFLMFQITQVATNNKFYNFLWKLINVIYLYETIKALACLS